MEITEIYSTPPILVGDEKPWVNTRKNRSILNRLSDFIKGWIVKRKRMSTYMIPSNLANHEYEEYIERYLLLNNGVLKEGIGRATWLSEGQLFLKEHFWLAKEGSMFSLLFYTDSYTQVRHTYYVSNFNKDFFEIKWVSQRRESKNIDIKYVEVPMFYEDNSVGVINGY